MATRLIWNGDSGVANRDVGAATGAGDLLEPGGVYSVPAELADQLLASSQDWARVTDYDGLTLEQLRAAARDANIEGRSKLNRDELIAALRGATEADLPASTSETATGPTGTGNAGEGAQGAAGEASTQDTGGDQ